MRYGLSVWRSVLGAILAFALFGVIELFVGFWTVAIAVGNGLGEDCPGGCSRNTDHDIHILLIVGGITLLLVSMLATRSILGRTNREIVERRRWLLLAATGPLLSVVATVVVGSTSHNVAITVAAAIAAAIGWAWSLRSEVANASAREAARFPD